MIENMMDPNIIDYNIINCAIPSMITIENHYQINFGKPVCGPYLHEDLDSIILNCRTDFFRCRWYCVLSWGLLCHEQPCYDIDACWILQKHHL